MKKITLFFTIILPSLMYAQAPSSAASAPTARDAENVISLFTQTSDASTTVYDDITVSNFNPNWGSTSGNVTTETLNSDNVLKYPAFNYQGIVIGSDINISGMTTMHVDIWTNGLSPNVVFNKRNYRRKICQRCRKCWFLVKCRNSFIRFYRSRDGNF